jgi:hypothetical protein
MIRLKRFGSDSLPYFTKRLVNGVLVTLLGVPLLIAAESPELVFGPEQFDTKSAHEKSPNAAQRLRCFQVVDDDQTVSGKALAVALDKQLVREADFPILTAPGLDKPAVGLYRITVRMKMQGMLNSLGTGIYLDAGDVNRRTLYPNGFDEENVYKEFTLDFEVRPPAILEQEPEAFMDSLTNRMKLSPEQAGVLAKALQAKPNQVFAPEAADPVKFSEQEIRTINTHGATGQRVPVRLTFASSAHESRGTASPQPSLRKLTIDTIKVVRLPEPDSLVMRSVVPQYAWRRPGETQVFRVALHNRSGKDRESQVRLIIRYGLDGQLVLGEKPVTLKNGQQKTLVWNWDIPKTHPSWGQEVQAELVDGGQVKDTARGWFGVHQRNVAVMIPVSGEANTSVQWHHPYAPKPRVSNHDEFWAPTPYDSAGLVPEDISKPFLCGNSGKLESIAGLAERAKKNKDSGVASFFYLEGHGTGIKAWDLYLDKPEQVSDITPISDQFYTSRLNCVTQVIPAWVQSGRQEKVDLGPHVQFVMYNGLFKEPVDRVINGAIEFARLVGFDGIRWDSCQPFQAFNSSVIGTNFGKTEQELFDISVANFRRFQKEIRAAHPDFEWRMNAGMGVLMAKPPDPFDFNKARELVAKDFHAVFLANDAGIEEEGWGHSYPGFADYKNVCLNYLRAARYETAAYKSVGGHHAHMHNTHRGGFYTPDCIYLQLFTLLGGAHMDSANYTAMPDCDMDLGVYAARFSEFFWDTRLRPLEAIADKVSLNTEEDIWFSEAGFEKDTEKGTRLYTVVLINPPAQERWLKNRFGVLPAPIRKPIGVTVKIPEGFKKVKSVSLLDHSPYPAVKPLAFKETAGQVAFEMPDLVVFRVAAIEFEK